MKAYYKINLVLITLINAHCSCCTGPLVYVVCVSAEQRGESRPIYLQCIYCTTCDVACDSWPWGQISLSFANHLIVTEMLPRKGAKAGTDDTNSDSVEEEQFTLSTDTVR